MSDVSVETAMPEVDPVSDQSLGQETEGSTGSYESNTVEAPPDYFDINAHADKKVRIKVDGTEMEVPLAELSKGYQRQQDYTRKTQEAARIRQEAQQAMALQRALETDPKGTLKILQAALEDTVETPVEDEFVDPVEQSLRQEIGRLQQAIAPLHQERAMQQAQREVETLTETYGSLFADNRDSVIQAAIEMGTDLDTAFRIVAFDLIFAARQGESDYNSQQAAERAARERAKAEAASVVSDGGGASAAGTVAKPKPTNSLREALLESARELGMSLSPS
jgi:hypothetical protein